jgi:hypothetical protein
VESVIAQLESYLNGQPITALNMAVLCVQAMQIAEKYSHLKGVEKKALVLAAIESMLTRQKGDLALLAILPSFIDTTISVEKGRLHIAVDMNKASSCCSIL